ncbi:MULTISPECIES: beta-ketoacyl synthase [Rahnella]|uniref:Beta-ketoacyl-[acyl-carrier-protein] synthase family protein n=1 Tax=Rahnella laticis TaxID=2787622 RepID=A0ABS0E2Z8_9GAMM|nr:MULTISPECIES: beta-ketoacyl-[acyl-carrier-protein] synthase family protein [Rahnella]MBF7978375.1 beta-ketoacyl-[acyl-carrier-protein] synthase family protein [Rahnella laticis]MBF7997908.1 beta-ketoacyl-[acyl-carrier-protein] synthase family protein [Rahnella sp. LAC-M12]
MKNNPPPRRVVVTGYGAITPLALTASENWEAIMANQLGYRLIDKRQAGIKSRFFGVIDEKLDLRFLPAVIRRRLPRFAHLAMIAACEAMQMAFGDKTANDYYASLRSGVVVGTGWGGIDETLASHEQYQSSGVGSPFACFYSMPSIATAACSQLWGLRGYQNSPVAACATGTMAIGEAFEIIRSGRADMMLSGGAESLRSDSAIWNIDVLQALTREEHDITKASCPFSLDRSGFVLSEGAAIVCLEERESAISRGAIILGEIKGYGNFSDAVDFTAPAEDKLARVKTIHAALAQSGLQAADLDYINAHGTSTQLNDRNETEAIIMALGEQAHTISISSTKSYSGHLIGAAGSFEAIICLKAIEHQRVPATCNLHLPDPQCALDFIAEGHRYQPVENTLNLSFGFGGANAALVIGRG